MRNQQLFLEQLTIFSQKVEDLHLFKALLERSIPFITEQTNIDEAMHSLEAKIHSIQQSFEHLQHATHTETIPNCDEGISHKILEQSEQIATMISTQSAMINVYENYTAFLRGFDKNELLNEINMLCSIHKVYQEKLEQAFNDFILMLQRGEEC